MNLKKRHVSIAVVLFSAAGLLFSSIGMEPFVTVQPRPSPVETTAEHHTTLAQSTNEQKSFVDDLHRCRTRKGEALNGSAGPIAADIPFWELNEDIIQRVCQQHGLARRTGRIPRLVYAVMFGIELDMLEVVLHEVLPVADVVFVTESVQTHSLGRKQLLFDSAAADRFERFIRTGKVKHLVYTPSRQYKSGWDVERRQRNYFLRHLSDIHITDGDIIMGNIDLDELLSRETLIRLKYCNVTDTTFKLVHFRYDLTCLQETTYNTYFDTMFVWNSAYAKTSRIDLYARRRHRNVKPIAAVGETRVTSEGLLRTLRSGGAWHMSAFGGLEAVVAKSRNSPHTHLRLNRDDIARSMASCTYQDTPRVRVNVTWFMNGSDSWWPPIALPFAITQRPCRFVERGWL